MLKKTPTASQTWQNLNRKFNEHKRSSNVVLTEKLEEVQTEVFPKIPETTSGSADNTLNSLLTFLN